MNSPDVERSLRPVADPWGSVSPSPAAVEAQTSTTLSPAGDLLRSLLGRNSQSRAAEYADTSTPAHQDVERALAGGRDDAMPAQQVMGYRVNLGYTEPFVSSEDMSRKPWLSPTMRCCPCCLPCCTDGLFQGLKQFFWTTGAAWSLTCLVTIAQIVVFAVEISAGGFVPFEENPMLGPGVCTLLAMGAKFTPYIAADMQIWRLVTPIFLHAGVIHLAVNLQAQFLLGLQLEYGWGTARMGATYFLAGIVGNVCSAVGSPLEISVGASGAILGLLGGQLGHTLATWSEQQPRERASKLQGILLVAIILAIIGMQGPVDNWAHVGGGVTGLVMGLFFFRGSFSRTWLKYAAVLLLLLACVALAGLLSALFELHKKKTKVTCP